MAKLDWQTRWQNTLEEKLVKFTVSLDQKQLQKMLQKAGFKISFNKRKQLSEFNLANKEIADTLDCDTCPYPANSKNALTWRWCKWHRTDDHRQFQDECKKAGMKYGLDWRTVFQALFLPNAEVEIWPFTKPRWYLEPVFGYWNQDIMDRLDEAMPPGTALRWVSEPPPELHEDLPNVDTYNIYRLIIEFPLDFPNEGVLQQAREASAATRKLCEAIEREVKQRIRRKPILKNSKQLRLGRVLSSGEVYDIIDEIDGEDTDLSQDQKKRRRIIDRRYKVKKHLTSP